MQLQPAAQRQSLVAVRAEQRVDEPEPSRGARKRHDEAGRLGLLQGLQHREQRRTMTRGEQVGIELGAERRGEIQDGAGLGVERPLTARQQR